MTYTVTDDTEMQQVFRAAEGLGVGVFEAADTLDAFRQVFSNAALERQIFEMIDKLDAGAEAKGEPEGLMITYEVEIRSGGGVWVGRYADLVPEGETVLQMPDRAAIFLRLKEGIRPKDWLGPLIIRRPEPQTEPVRELTIRERFFPESAWPVWSSDDICDIQPYLLFPDRFPLLVRSVFDRRNIIASLKTASPALTASLRSGGPGNSTLCAFAASRSGHHISGLSPPKPIGDRGHSGRKLSRRISTQHQQALARSGSLTI